MASATYLIAIGSNRRGRHGAPPAMVAAAVEALGGWVPTHLVMPGLTRHPCEPQAPADPLVTDVSHGPRIKSGVTRGAGIIVLAAAPIVTSAPIGPSRRRYANTAVLVASDLPPPAMLAHLQALEAAFGRRRARRWGERVLDLDIILWSGGIWASAGLAIPHVAFRQRGFVLAPAAALAPDWRDPVTGRTLRQLAARIRHPRPVDPMRTRP